MGILLRISNEMAKMIIGSESARKSLASTRGNEDAHNIETTSLSDRRDGRSTSIPLKVDSVYAVVCVCAWVCSSL